MGVDITMHIIQKDKYLAKDIYDGRCSEWFTNLQGSDRDPVYHNLPIHCGVPDERPEDWQIIPGDFYYGHHYMKATDFCDWFETMRPDLDAGWVTTREKWEYEQRDIIPELKYKLSSDDVVEDMHFIEVSNPKDQSLWLYNYLLQRYYTVFDDIFIVYKFDR